VQRYVAPLGGVAALALTAGLACDNGGFDALSWNRALVLVSAAALALAIVGGAERPGRLSAALLAALAFLTAWTAASWLWSDSPPLALEEAQRVALYLVVAALVALAGTRASPTWIAGGVVAGAVVVALWNLVTRIRGVANPDDLGALAQPVGYANALALLCVLALLLLPCLPRLALIAAVPLGVVLVLQESVGSYAALAAGVLALAPRRARAVATGVVLAGIVAAATFGDWHDRTRYWRVALDEARDNPVLGSGAGTFRDWWLRERTVPLTTHEAHSLYVETLAELGPLALAALLVVLAVGVVAALRIRRPELAAAVLAYAVGAAVDFDWELAGVTVPAIVLAASAAAHTSPGRRAAPRAALVPAFGALAVAGLLAYAGHARLEDARDALGRGDGARAASLARQSLRFAPYSADAWNLIGDAGSDAAAYRRAADLDPNDWYPWQRIAALSTGPARRHAMREAARLNPFVSGR